MKLLVADTGPLNYLIQIGSIGVLPGLAVGVIVPVEVLAELRAAEAPEEVRNWAVRPPSWIEVGRPVRPVAVSPEISVADRAAISLAKERNALLLMDDRRARKIAAEEAVSAIGTIGLLEAAAAKGLISLPAALGRL